MDEKIKRALDICTTNDFTKESHCEDCPYNTKGCSQRLAKDIARTINCRANLLVECTAEELMRIFLGRSKPRVRIAKRETALVGVM